MKKKSYYLLIFISSILITFSSLIIYLSTFHSISKIEAKNKNIFVQLTTLPDLALVTQSTYIRHRSLTDVFSIYNNDGVLREYDITSYTYAVSNIYKQVPSKVINEK